MNAAYRWCLSAVCWLAIAVLYGDAMYQHGVSHGTAAPKVCASVPGEQVVSTVADTCTYAVSFGRATKKRRAG